MQIQLLREKERLLEKRIAILYVYLLPIRMIVQFAPLKAAMHGAGVYFDVILHAVGIILFLLHTHAHGKIAIGSDQNAKLMQYAGMTVLLLNLSSIIMACIMQTIYGNHGVDSAFDGILGMLIYFIQYFLMFWYNREVFRLISREELTRILHNMCLALLILGYWQFLILNVGGIFSTIYDMLNVFGILRSSDMSKLCLTGSEPASAGGLIAILVMPFLYSQILTSNKKKKYIIEVLLWLPVVFMTRSSNAYILLTVSSAIAFFYLLVQRKQKRGGLILVMTICVCAMIFLLFPNTLLSMLPQDMRDQIQYLLLEKATDLTNGSTVSRMVPLIFNWGSFTEYPLLGVGNGLQGYFYAEYFPSWASNVPGSDVMVFYEGAKTTLVNGGVFFPSLLSGYGIFGIALIVGYIIKANRLVKSGRTELGGFYYLYRIACIAIFFAGLQGEFAGLYYLWFVLSIPFMVGIWRKKAGDSKEAIDNAKR